MKVHFRENNKGKGRILRRLQEEHPDIETTVKKCLGMCGPCVEHPVALAGGKKMMGKDGNDLYRRIVAALSEEGKKHEVADNGKKKLKK